MKIQLSSIDSTVRLMDIITLGAVVITLVMVLKSGKMDATLGGILDVRMITSEDISNRDIAEQLDQIMEAVLRNPNASLIDKAKFDAYILQRVNRIKEAIKKWDSIANIAKGHDKNLAASAWFSVGYLYQMKLMDNQEALNAFTKAIDLNTGYAEAYNSRALVKIALGELQEAVTDLEIAISLNPYYAAAYSNLGVVKLSLEEYNAAIDNYTTAIVLNKELAEARVNRGIAHANLGNIDKAKKDFQDGARLAHQQGNKTLKFIAEGWLQELSKLTPQDGEN